MPKIFKSICLMVVMALVLSLSMALVLPVMAADINLIENGDFETGDFEGWELDEYGYDAYGWAVYSSEDEFSGYLPGYVYAPPEGDYAAGTYQDAPSRLILYQDLDLESCGDYELSFYVFYINWNEYFYTPDTLDISGEISNQQYRIDIMDPEAEVDSVDDDDIYRMLFRTEVGDDPSMEPTLMTFDLSDYAGQTVRLRFAMADTAYYFFAGVDDVQLTSEYEPPTARISASALMGEAPLTVQFRGYSNQSDVEYDWSFDTGDTSDSRSPTYTFQNEGTYMVYLRVTNECGKSASDTVTIMVEAQNLPPVLVVQNLNISPTYANYGEPVYITATVFNEGGSWGSQDMQLLINGQFEQSTPVGVAAGTGQSINFTIYKTEAREYQVTIGDATGTFFIMEKAAQPTQRAGLLAGGELDTGGIIAIICIAVILVGGVVVVFLFAVRR